MKISIESAFEKARRLGGRDALNCIAELAENPPENTSDGPLAGVPVLVKDNIDVQGFHTTAGSLALADNLAAADAPIIRNLKKNGAVILGKTNMTEFANFTTAGMTNGYSSRGGQVVHALNPAINPSGSSTGSAVAVSAGIVSAAVGTDTSFSIIVCALENGVCGLKPPPGTLSADGIIPISRTLDSAGAIGKTFSDALALYSGMRDKPLPALTPANPAKLKIAINTANSSMFSDSQRNYLQDVFAALKARGASLDEVEQMPTGYLRVIMQWEFRTHLEDYLRTASASRKTLREIVDYYEENPETMMKYGITNLRAALDETPGGLDGAPYREALAEREAAIRRMHDAIGGYDAVIIAGPTNIMHFCCLPSATIIGKRKNEHGIPHGLMMYGTDELRLYRAALAIEGMLP